MNISLICFFLLFSLQDGNTGLVSAQLSVYSVTEGEDVRFKCSFPSYKEWKFFCQEPCEQEDILIETAVFSAQRGRYRIDYKTRDVFVTISQPTKSDSGKYRCGVGPSSGTTYENIEIIVVDAILDGDPFAEKTIDARSGGNIVVECSFTQYGTEMFFCKEECEGEDNLVEMTSDTYTKKGRYSIRHVIGGFVFVSIKQLTQSDSGWYRCGLGRPDSKDPNQRFRLIVTDALNTSPKTTEQPETTGVILYVSLTLVVLVVVLSLSVLVFCRKRTCKDKSEEPEPHVETQCASAPEAEDDPSQHAYSEIKFVRVGSSHGGFHGDAECVFYSVPWVEASSDEPPLYSTVNNPQ